MSVRYYSSNCTNGFVFAGLFFFVCGVIILVVSGIGYSISKHQNEIFDETSCNVTAILPLATKMCLWCLSITVNNPCCSQMCNNICTCITTQSQFISYTCSAAVWAVIYNTNPVEISTGNNCPNFESSTISGNYQDADGNHATQKSEAAALADQATRSVGSTYKCHFNRNKCKEVKWNLSNSTAWRSALISGGAIAGFGLLLMLIAICISYQVCTVIYELLANYTTLGRIRTDKTVQYQDFRSKLTSTKKISTTYRGEVNTTNCRNI